MRTLGRYLAALAVCLLVLASVFDLGAEARKWPYAYEGDTMFYHLIAKSVAEGRWFLDVPLLGAPGALNLRDVPTSDNNLHVLMLWVLSLGIDAYPTVLNNFFLLTFPLVFISALVVMRHFGVGWPAAVCASLLYAFAPFHLTRGEQHLFLSAYWPVPLAVLIALWVSQGGFAGDGTPTPWRRTKWTAGILICLMLGATGYYHAFFACFFLLVAAILSGVRQRRWRGAWPALVLSAIISSSVVANLWPSVAHFAAAGTSQTVRRQAADADQFGLRVAQLLMPVSGHRLGALEDVKDGYNQRPFVNENDAASLGGVAALGFLALLWGAVFWKPSTEGATHEAAHGLLHDLSRFSLAGLLFGTIGGFGSLVAFFGLPEVRAYNRISVFLSFFALFAVAIWLDRLWSRHVALRPARVWAYPALAAITLLALLDQISPRTLPQYNRIRVQYSSDEAFIRELERRVPHGAQIFQLPFMSFPESSQVSHMRDYDPLRGYLHSDHLRWSYGTLRGRDANAWLRHTSSKPADRLLETLVWAGFSGVYIDRYGFADNGKQMESDFYAVLQELPLRSTDQRFLFYALTTYRERLESQTPRVEWAERREAALHPPLIVWREGFSDPAGQADKTWRWGAATGLIELVNGSPRAQRVRLQMTVTATDAKRSIRIRTPLLAEPVQVHRHRPDIQTTLVLPPGRHPVRFESDAHLTYAADDLYNPVFAVENFELTPLTP